MPLGPEPFPAPPPALGGTRTGRAPFTPVRGLAALASFAGFGLAVSGLYALTGFGFPCPLRAVTGWECPLCGGTRLGSALLHGHLGQAFLYNPAVFVLLAVLTLLGGLWTVEVLGGPKVRLPRRLARRLAAVHPTRWTVLILAFAVAYTLARNLL